MLRQVTVSEGILEGEILENEYGKTYYSFKGIPYAEPPIGDLRFKAPQPKKPWEGVRSAKEFGPSCYQIYFVVSPKAVGSEDCLYLNVYTPTLKPTKPLPVMFWIHGGGFFSGSGNDDLFGPEFLVRHDVILVTVNYRLEVLGFLCLDSEKVPGNAGMKDQVAALRWVKKNIRSFGGDPGNITIFGESAGGASVSFHLISPMSKGLFRRAIMQSGAACNSWAMPTEPRERALSLARQLGCYSDNDKELYEFFKNQPLEKLVFTQATITKGEELGIFFGVVDEKKFGDSERFFYGDVIDALRTRSHDVEVIIGYNEDEGLMSLLAPGNSIEKLVETANKQLDFFIPRPIAFNCNLKDQFEAARKLKKFYLNNSLISVKDCDTIFNYVAMGMFVYEIVLQAKIFATYKRNVYLYKFTCKSERNYMAGLMGLTRFIGDKVVVSHADEIAYLFPTKVTSKVDTDSPTFIMINRMTTLWTNFAKYGNPTPDDSLGVKWSNFTNEKQDYLEIGNEIVAGTNPDKEEIEVWERTYKEHLPNWSP